MEDTSSAFKYSKGYSIVQALGLSGTENYSEGNAFSTYPYPSSGTPMAELVGATDVRDTSICKNDAQNALSDEMKAVRDLITSSDWELPSYRMLLDLAGGKPYKGEAGCPSEGDVACGTWNAGFRAVNIPGFGAPYNDASSNRKMYGFWSSSSAGNNFVWWFSASEVNGSSSTTQPGGYVERWIKSDTGTATNDDAENLKGVRCFSTKWN